MQALGGEHMSVDRRADRSTPARAGLGLGEHRHGGVVDMQALGGEHMSAWLVASIV